MKRRSSISLNSMLKGVKILAPYPWIVSKLVRLQLDKWLFPHTIPQVDKGFAKKIHQLSIRITDICGLRCHTCGQWGDNGFMHGQDLRGHVENEVPWQMYLEVFDDLLANGHHPNVYLWGGEPMMYKGILKVISGATKRGFPVSIATNGHLLKQRAEELISVPLFLLQVSIDGHTQVIHDQARPSAAKGSAFHDVTTGLEEVRKIKDKSNSRLPVVASLTVVSDNNVEHLVDIYNRFHDYVDVFVFYLSWWIDEENASKHEDDFSSRFGFSPQLHRGWIGNWRPDDYDQLSQQIGVLKKLSRKMGAPAVTILPHLESAVELESYYTDHNANFGYRECISIYQVAEVDSNGDLSPCRDYHDYVVGNIKDKPISELWNNGAYQKFRSSLRKEGLMPVCKRCCGLMGY